MESVQRLLQGLRVLEARLVEHASPEHVAPVGQGPIREQQPPAERLIPVREERQIHGLGSAFAGDEPNRGPEVRSVDDLFALFVHPVRHPPAQLLPKIPPVQQRHAERKSQRDVPVPITLVPATRQRVLCHPEVRHVASDEVAPDESLQCVDRRADARPPSLEATPRPLEDADVMPCPSELDRCRAPGDRPADDSDAQRTGSPSWLVRPCLLRSQSPSRHGCSPVTEGDMPGRTCPPWGGVRVPTPPSHRSRCTPRGSPPGAANRRPCWTDWRWHTRRRCWRPCPVRAR